MKTILVIEDQIDVRSMIYDFLTRQNFEIIMAESGEEGIEKAGKYLPDLIISDIMMGGISGFEVLRNLQNDIKTSSIPFLFLTARAELKDFREGMNLGADDYLIKPFKLDELLIAVNTRLAKRQKIEDKFKLVWEYARDGMCIIEENGKIITINNATEKLFNLKAIDIIDSKYTELFKNDLCLFDQTNSLSSFTEKCVLWNNSVKWLKFSISILEENQNGKIFFVMIQDVTDSKNSEMQIVKSLNEKEVLLKEIHHRVKNNLQIISSILSLQSDNFDDPKYKKVFLESQNQIKSMALVHEKLYQSGELNSINFNGYTEDLINYLKIAFDIYDDRIKFKMDISNAKLQVNTAIPMGLIVNELITNSLKHAFDEKKGEINIIIKDREEYFDFFYSDNGIGLPDDFNLQSITSLGLSLVINLVEQIGGSLDFENNNGAIFKFKIPK